MHEVGTHQEDEDQENAQMESHLQEENDDSGSTGTWSPKGRNGNNEETGTTTATTEQLSRVTLSKSKQYTAGT